MIPSGYPPSVTRKRKKERNPSICNALNHGHYQNQTHLGFAPNMNPNYSDGNAHRPTLLHLLGLYSTTLGTQTKCNKQTRAHEQQLWWRFSLSLSLALFQTKQLVGIWVRHIHPWPTVLKRPRICVSDPEPTVLSKSPQLFNDVPWNASSVPVFLKI